METKILDVLDSRIKGLLQVIHDLQRKNAMMVMQLEEVELRLEKQAGEVGRWEGERQMVRDKIESVLNELELVGDSPRGTAVINGED
ncbi:MAG: hypothetical protein CMH81_03985 [Nitrospiraceae bacterium]|nr:hypothetical protein [Nitrospiraceae bacterium]|tara:strand:+ start:129 stop:389 length:261 start_codon:yes stop_codon:yes gene_type:complete